MSIKKKTGTREWSEHSLIFKGEMVRAILESRKTMTRRIIKKQPNSERCESITFDKDYGWRCGNEIGGNFIRCPYGKPGDRLWVRETWGIHKPGSINPEKMPTFEYEACTAHGDIVGLEDGYGLPYRATAKIDPDFPIHWRPSIFMPRWASRITLEITVVRAERLQEITEEDAKREGIKKLWTGPDEDGYGTETDGPSLGWNGRRAFETLWDSINAKPKPVKGEDGTISHYVSYPWEEIRETRIYRGKPWHVIGNPWVWALSLRRI
jgi:hypothetical protein